MAAIITDAFRIESTKSLYDYLTSGIHVPYITLGKNSPWDTIDVDAVPENNIRNLSRMWQDIIVGRRILVGDVSIVVNRFDWELGESYATYDTDNPNMVSDDNKFYVITDDNNVYKCLWNNFGAPSTTKPTGTALTTINLADGYVWKYMFTVSFSDADSFLSPQFIPVKLNPSVNETQSIVEDSATPGAIDSVLIRAKGTGYTTASITITGDGTGALAVPILSGGEIVGISIANPGSGYTWAESTVVGNGIGGVVSAQVPPRGGHGSSSVSELGGYYIMIQMKFGDESSQNVPANFAFRKIGILVDPLTPEFTPFTDLVLVGTYKVYTAIAPQFLSQEIAVFPTGEASVVESGSDSNGTYLILSDITADIFVGATFIKKTDSGIVGLVFDVVEPTVLKNSWEPFFIEHRRPISKSENQVEQLRVVIEF